MLSPFSSAAVMVERSMFRVASGMDHAASGFGTISPSTSFMPTISAARASDQSVVLRISLAKVGLSNRPRSSSASVPVPTAMLPISGWIVSARSLQSQSAGS